MLQIWRGQHDETYHASDLQLLKSVDYASMRRLFAFFAVNECNQDFSSTSLSQTFRSATKHSLFIRCPRTLSGGLLLRRHEGYPINLVVCIKSEGNVTPAGEAFEDKV
jgi:hypothetical protein